VAIVLFLDEKYQPESCPILPALPNQLILGTLEGGLKAVGNQAGVLTVLKPLRLSKPKLLPKLVPQWVAELRSLPKLSPRQTHQLLELLEYAILKRFPKLTVKEVEQLMQLTPLEQTVAGQELIQIGVARGTQKGLQEGITKGRREGLAKGRLKGRQEGLAKGRLVGQIHLAQRLLKRPVTPQKILLDKNLKELRVLLKQLEAELI
jgi:hypothetical protein